jgi:hypothetical protein
MLWVITRYALTDALPPLLAALRPRSRGLSMTLTPGIENTSRL